MQGFKQFLMRGNVVDMAVGIVVGWHSALWLPRSSRI
jgi:large-conductance mechanosensitive channel